MVPLTVAPQNAVATKSKPLVWLAWLVVVALLAYFVFTKAPRYFVFSEKSYGSYFWPKVSWLFPHVVCGVLAAVLGPLQFWPRMRRDYLSFHRIAGRIYVIGALIGAVAGIGMAAKIGTADATYALGLSGLAVAWAVTTSMAFVAIRRKNLLQHKQWMIRSYVVTFAFVTFRLAEDLISAGNILPPHELAATLAWGCWAVPLLITEVIIQGSAVLKER